MEFSIVQSIRSLDFVSAFRAWSSARERYLQLGLEIGQPAPDSGAEDYARRIEERRRMRTMADDALLAVQRGDDEAALALFSSVFSSSHGGLIIGALADVATQKIVFDRLEQALPTLHGNLERLQRYSAWLTATSALDLTPYLRDEAALSAAAPERKNCLLKAFQSRAMEAWARLHEETHGFTAPPTVIAERMEAIADEPGYSRMTLSIVLPVFAQSMASFEKLQDRHEALRDLVAAMVTHAETGAWPDIVEPTVRIVRGTESATLRLQGAHHLGR